MRTEWDERAADGGLYRKRGMVRHLAAVAGERFEEFALPRGGGASRAGRALQAARRLVGFCETSRAEAVLFFYPEFPLFHPAAAWKLPFLRALLGAMRAALGRRGARLVLDVEDLPLAQHHQFTGRTHPAAGAVALAERWLGELADELWFPSSALARGWPGAQAERRVVPTGAARHVGRPRESGPVRFVYAGTLVERQERGVRFIVERFLASKRADARLCFAGPGGDWLRPFGDRVEWAGALADDECERYVSGCDYGLIPYPERGYFHEVFPAKVAFYAACGIPIVSTRLGETAAALELHGAGSVLGPDEWAGFFGSAPPRPDEAGRPGPWLWPQILL